jgi:hypothetical protein
MADVPNQGWPFSKPLEFLHKVKYGGVVGKKTVITVVALIVLAIAILAMWGKVEPVLLIVAVVLIILFGAFRSIDASVKAHPELALMDGSEWVAYKKAEMAAKHITILPAIAEPVPDPGAPTGLLAIAEPEESEEED